MNITFIYALIDPLTNEVRYIGKANNPWKRLHYRHLLGRILNKSKTHKNDWIKSLLKKNKIPILQILEQCYENDWRDREKDWIAFYQKIGADLTNATDGGEGFASGEKNPSSSLESRLRIKNQRIGKKHSKETKLSMSEARKGKIFKPHSEETKDKIRKSLLGHNVSKESIRKRRKTLMEKRRLQNRSKV